MLAPAAPSAISEWRSWRLSGDCVCGRAGQHTNTCRGAGRCMPRARRQLHSPLEFGVGATDAAVAVPVVSSAGSAVAAMRAMVDVAARAGALAGHSSPELAAQPLVQAKPHTASLALAACACHTRRGPLPDGDGAGRGWRSHPVAATTGLHCTTTRTPHVQMSAAGALVWVVRPAVRPVRQAVRISAVMRRARAHRVASVVCPGGVIARHTSVWRRRQTCCC